MYTKVNLQNSLFPIRPITVNGKIHSTNFLLEFKYCIRRLMVLKEVYFTTLYILCVSIVRKSLNSLFTIVHKVQHCTGYPLIQVEIVSVCKSHYVYWLASQSSLLISLFLECVVVFRLSPVWVQEQVQVCLLQVQECLLQFLPFFLKYRIRGSIWFCQIDKVR